MGRMVGRVRMRKDFLLEFEGFTGFGGETEESGRMDA